MAVLPYQEYIKHSSINDADVKWTGMPLVSAVSSARLVIEGPVIDVSLQVAAGGEKFNPRYFVVGNATVSHGPRESSPIPWSVAAQFDAFDQPSKASYRCLLVSTRAHREIEAYREIFLILEPEAGSMSTSMYRRIGIGCFLGKCVEFGNAKKERVHLV
ncbi:hypothetical protein PRZ48_014122 [Zasmidium cellare]|uniref:Uncharacterized protein n=1 Tax=Zasmidium cellare TaxID=395010 RepID=A0ABR0E0J7_ZASCE|nr:hypothetical protein PRZ48_014122 [Zasmidium cellare]